MNVLKKLRDGYIFWHANQFELPQFNSSNLVRKNITFSGKVQNVGFRLEVFHLAERLGLTGWVKNLEDGSVEAEFQGEEAKIDYLAKCMKSLKRASVKKLTIIDMPIHEGEEDFTIVR